MVTKSNRKTGAITAAIIASAMAHGYDGNPRNKPIYQGDYNPVPSPVKKPIIDKLKKLGCPDSKKQLKKQSLSSLKLKLARYE